MKNYAFTFLLLFLLAALLFNTVQAQNKSEPDRFFSEMKSDSLTGYSSVPDSSVIEIPFCGRISFDLTNFNMKVYIPDSTLTDNMPVLKPGLVDEKMVIPHFLRKQDRPSSVVVQ